MVVVALIVLVLDSVSDRSWVSDGVALSSLVSVGVAETDFEEVGSSVRDGVRVRLADTELVSSLVGE